LKTLDPVATKQSLSSVQPVTCACGPTSTRSPIRSGWRGVARNTAFSMITQSDPISTLPPSAVMTAPYRMLLSAPTTTSPLNVAFGAT
jgi:hypothetical protein